MVHDAIPVSKCQSWLLTNKIQTTNEKGAYETSAVEDCESSDKNLTRNRTQKSTLGSLAAGCMAVGFLWSPHMTATRLEKGPPVEEAIFVLLKSHLSISAAHLGPKAPVKRGGTTLR